MDWTTLAIVFAVTILLSWLYNKWRLNYWARRGVPCAPVTPFFGHTPKLFDNLYQYNNEVYNKYGGSVFSGRYEFFTPTLFVGDPELVKHIVVKDFDHFVNHRKLHFSKKDNYWRHMLFSADDDHWKKLRNIMTPNFSSGKIKGMFKLVSDSADNLVKHLMSKSDDNYQFEPKDVLGGFSLDALATCAFGMETNTVLNKDLEFKEAVENLFEMDIWVGIQYMIVSTLPLSVIKFFDLSSFGGGDKPQVKYLKRLVEHTIQQRRNGGITRGDFIDLLLEAEKNHPETVNMDVLISQTMLFLLAGHSTASITGSFIVYYLAKHSQYQEKIRQEMQEKVSEHGSLNYQAIMEMPLLDAFIQEAMRMNPVGVHIERECTKDYKLHNTDLNIPKGMVVQIPVWSLHNDPRYWPEPEEFRAERFLPENKHQITPYTYLPFGLGPRMCIATRFANMNMKIMLAKLLQSFSLELVAGKEELQLTQQLDMLAPKDLWLIAKPLNDCPPIG